MLHRTGAELWGIRAQTGMYIYNNGGRATKTCTSRCQAFMMVVYSQRFAKTDKALRDNKMRKIGSHGT